MTRVTFGVSASSFAANMAVRQNAIDIAHEFPLAAEVVNKSFYVDNCLTGATDSESALLLQQQLTELFARGGFVLRKWNSNDPSVLEKIPEDLRDSREVHTFCDANLGLSGILILTSFVSISPRLLLSIGQGV